PKLQILDVSDAEPHGRGVEAPFREGQREQVALDPLQSGRLPPRTLEHPFGEVEAGHATPLTGGSDGEVTRPAARVQHRVAWTHHRASRRPAPALAEAGALR